MINGCGLGGYGWLLVLVAALPMAVGCGKSTDAPTDPGSPAGGGASATLTPQTIDGFAQSFASRYCESIAACCSRQGLATGDCKTTLQTQLRALLQAQTTNQKIRYNADAAQGCIDAYAAALSACTDPTLLSKTDEACDTLLEGTVALGGECGDSDECVGSNAGVSCMTGVCAMSDSLRSLYGEPHRKLGETCSGTCDGDSRSASCSGSQGANVPVGACWIQDGVICTNGVCARAPEVGEACATSSQYCVATAHCAGGVCAADSSSGPCTTANQCLAPTICDYTLQMCVPPKENGEPCDQSSQCAGGQCFQNHCRTWSVAEPGACLGVLDD